MKTFRQQLRAEATWLYTHKRLHRRPAQAYVSLGCSIVYRRGSLSWNKRSCCIDLFKIRRIGARKSENCVCRRIRGQIGQKSEVQLGRNFAQLGRKYAQLGRKSEKCPFPNLDSELLFHFGRQTVEIFP